jgi:hypothetical protein
MKNPIEPDYPGNWPELDAAIQENRRGGQMNHVADEYPDVHFNYGGMGDPWTQLYGAFKGDSYFEEWQIEINAYRMRCDADDGIAQVRELTKV